VASFPSRGARECNGEDSLGIDVFQRNSATKSREITSGLTLIQAQSREADNNALGSRTNSVTKFLNQERF